MRKTQNRWQRRWSRKWSKTFVAISLGLIVSSGGVGSPLTWASNGKKPSKPAKPAEKVARKTDDTNKSVAPAKETRETPQAVPADHPLKPFIDRAEASLKSVEKLKDYSTVMFKQEQVQGKLVNQTLQMKIRHEPFSVYLKFDQPHAGREVIYVEGLNKGKFLVHEAGFRSLAGTLSFLPNSKEAMAENRYPITQAGMAKMLDAVIEQWKLDAKYQEVQVKELTGMKVGEQPCIVLETVHPQPRDYFKYHKTRLYLDETTGFPIRAEQYVWPDKEGGAPVLVEEYTYTQIKSNQGMSDIDFDKSNPAYHF